MTSYKVGDLAELFTKGRTKEQIIASRNEALQAGPINEAVRKAKEMKAKIDKEKEKQKLKEEQKLNSGSQDSESVKKQTPKKLKRKSDISNSQAEDGESLVKKGKNVNKKKKQKMKKLNAQNNQPAGYDPPPGMVHESLLQKGKKGELGEDDVSDDENEQGKNEGVGNKDHPVGKRKKIDDDDLDVPRKKRKYNQLSHTPDEDGRTIFIGNLSLKFKPKELIKIFSKFGKIESVRQRCVPVKDPEQLKRVAAIKKEFHEERNNCVCFIKFMNDTSAKKALINNGMLIDGLHIQVDLADGTGARDPKRTVFVANLPYDVGEEPVRAHFEDCGEIENVRIVRHNQTGLGKGFGYVKFADVSSVHLALKLNGSSFKSRSLRVQSYDSKTPSEKSSNKSWKPNRPAAANSNPRPTSNTDTFQGEMAKREKKRSKKSNAKSGASGIFAINKPQKIVNKNASDKVDTNTKKTKSLKKDKSGTKVSPRDKKHKRVSKPNKVDASFPKKNVSKAGKKKSS